MPESVFQLTSAIASGDTEAFSRFYEAWFVTVLTEARVASLRDEQFCLDIVQETMLRVIRGLKPINDHEHLRRWLRVVVQSCCIDALRRERRRRVRDRSAAAPDAHAAPRGDDRIPWLLAQLDELDAEQRRLLDMRFRFGWTLRRIGAVMGLREGAVDGRINRALLSLRRRARGIVP